MSDPERRGPSLEEMGIKQEGQLPPEYEYEENVKLHGLHGTGLIYNRMVPGRNGMRKYEEVPTEQTDDLSPTGYLARKYPELGIKFITRPKEDPRVEAATELGTDRLRALWILKQIENDPATQQMKDANYLDVDADDFLERGGPLSREDLKKLAARKASRELEILKKKDEVFDTSQHDPEEITRWRSYHDDREKLWQNQLAKLNVEPMSDDEYRALTQPIYDQAAERAKEMDWQKRVEDLDRTIDSLKAQIDQGEKNEDENMRLSQSGLE
jgi:hypothetical protein